ncbi:MAG: hypothetical protein SGPRY_008903 [Prymnesium sp.]
MATSIVRHQYRPHSRSFEQSLDVVFPTSPTSLPAHPLVVLVVGSGWLGHSPLVYFGTSWWNSSGPKTVARLGAVCVCVRHRGAFPPLSFALMCALFFFSWLITRLWCAHSFFACLFAIAMSCLLGALWSAAATSSATFEQMLDDVAAALQWVQANRSSLPTHGKGLLFGGYSSGAHVAMSLLHRPDLLRAYSLPSGLASICIPRVGWQLHQGVV